MKRFIALALVVLTLVSLVSCDIEGAMEKHFTYNGLTVTLTKLYTNTEATATTATYISVGNAVIISMEDITAYPQLKDLSLKEYGEAFIEANKQFVQGGIQEKDGLVYTELVIENEGQSFKYFTTFHKNDEAFWNVKFGCLESEYDNNIEEFQKFAKTVRFEK